MRMQDYEPFDYQDCDKSLAWKLSDAHRRIREQYNRIEERKQLKEEIKKEVLDEIRIQINDEASPVLKDLNREISNLFK